jgi:hypothetical protein
MREANHSAHPLHLSIEAGVAKKAANKQAAVTPFGGVAVFISFLRRIGEVRQCMPIQWKSPNHIDPTDTFVAFPITVLVGAKRFAHLAPLRGDQALHALPGMKPFPVDDTIRNLFRAFGMGQVQRPYEPLGEWQMERLPQRPDGYTLDLDSTVFDRTLRQARRLAERAQSAQTRPSQPSSFAGRVGRGAFPHPRLAPQWQLRNRPWGGGIS